MAQAAIFLVYITGHPGSGKTTTAHALLNILEQRRNLSVHLFSDKNRPSPIRWLTATWWVVRHSKTLVRTAILIQQGRRDRNLRIVARSFVRATRLMLSQFALVSSIKQRVADIVIADEPPLHRLWTAIFPANRPLSVPLLATVVSELLNFRALECTTLYVALTPPPDVCVDRFTKRRLETSRFDFSTNKCLISSVLADDVYPSIQRAVNSASELTCRLNVDSQHEQSVLSEIARRVG
jgi:hypothetical protein